MAKGLLSAQNAEKWCALGVLDEVMRRGEGKGKGE